MDTDAIVAPAEPLEYPALRALVIEGLREHWGEYDHAQNADLEAFGEVYASAVVLAAKVEGRIVGCGVLVRERDTVGRIVRMSVLAKERRRGIGGKLLQALLAEAQVHGYSEVVLETTATWQSAISFYAANGFVSREIKDGDLHLSKAMRSNKSLDTEAQLQAAVPPLALRSGQLQR